MRLGVRALHTSACPRELGVLIREMPHQKDGSGDGPTMEKSAHDTCWRGVLAEKRVANLVRPNLRGGLIAKKGFGKI